MIMSSTSTFVKHQTHEGLWICNQGITLKFALVKGKVEKFRKSFSLQLETLPLTHLREIGIALHA